MSKLSPLLQDEDVRHFEACGVKNETCRAGASGRGIPRPGILFINARGLVASRFADRGFKKRAAFEAVYAAIGGE